MTTPKPFGRPSKSGLSAKMLGQREYTRQLHAKKTGQHVEDFDPRPGEIPLKEWMIAMAQKLHISADAIRMKLSRHTIEPPPLRRVNKRVIFVIQ